MKAPTLILMDVDQHAGLPFPRSLREFQRLFPGDAACAEYLEKVRWGAASSVRIVASLVSRFASRPALVCWHAAAVDVRQDLFLSTDTSSANMPSLGGNS